MISRYRLQKFMNSCLFSIATFLPFFYMTYDLKSEILYNDPLKTVGDRLVDTLCYTPLIPLHYWISFSVFLFFVLPWKNDYANILRINSRKQWLYNELKNLIEKIVLFSIFHTSLTVLGVFFIFGFSPILLQCSYGSSAYSLLYVIFSTVFLKILSGMTIGFTVFILYTCYFSRKIAILLGGFWGILSTFILFYGTFLKEEMFKYFIFPANISHYYFLTGNPVNNYLSGILSPTICCCLLFYFLCVLYKKRNIL